MGQHQVQTLALYGWYAIKVDILGAVAATVFTLQMGVVSAGIVAIPISLSALFGIWVYVTLKPSVRVCLGLERD